MRGFITIDRQTDYLLPPLVGDWLPENHLARFIVEVIDKLDLSELTRMYGGHGSAAHHPAVLLALLIYGRPQFARHKIHDDKQEKIAAIYSDFE